MKPIVGGAAAAPIDHRRHHAFEVEIIAAGHTPHPAWCHRAQLRKAMSDSAHQIGIAFAHVLCEVEVRAAQAMLMHPAPGTQITALEVMPFIVEEGAGRAACTGSPARRRAGAGQGLVLDHLSGIVCIGGAGAGARGRGRAACSRIAHRLGLAGGRW